MKKGANIVFLVVLGMLLALQSKSQQKRPHIVTWSQFQQDSLKLLWMPVRASDWLQWSEMGYWVERADVIRGKQMPFKKLLPRPLLPMSNSAWIPKSAEEKTAKELVFSKTAQARFSGESSFRDVANEQELRYLLVTMSAFKSSVVAQNLGLSLVDTSAKKGQQYVYRISPNWPDERKRIEGSVQVRVSTQKATSVIYPPQLEIESGERLVKLSWRAKKFVSAFAMYHIERTDDGKTFKRLSKMPILYNALGERGEFVDSVKTNYRRYGYRLVGLTHFGQWIASPFVRVGMGKDRTPPREVEILSALNTEGKKVVLKWKHQDSDGDMAGFYVSRSNSVSQGYKRLNLVLQSKKSSEFVDFQADVNGTNYYIVTAVDTAGNERSSIPTYAVMKDTIPPAFPRGLIAKVDTLKKMAVVTLRWQQNTEKDLKGYRVYSSNHPSGKLLEITRTLLLKDTVYRDTIPLRILTKKVEYRVAAVDYHYNHSRFSEKLEVKRPDIIRPIAPLITSLTTDAKSITVKWQPSVSNDIKAYNLYRREENKEWVRVKSFQGNELSVLTYKDPAVKEGQTYEYSIEVMDEEGLVSERSPGVAQTVVGSVYLEEAPELKAVFDNEKKKVILTWRLVKYANYQLIVFRSFEKRPLQPIATIASTQKEFADLLLTKGEYSYVVKAVLPSGKQSLFSAKTTVKSY